MPADSVDPPTMFSRADQMDQRELPIGQAEQLEG
jgi:hypothetical protein